MPKYRKLYTKTVDSLDINDMPDDFTRLFWVLLPLALDREGRGMDNLAWLKSKVFPLRLDVTGDMICDAMAWWESRKMIERYQGNGRSYFWVPTFAKYQGNTVKEAASEFPAPPGWTEPQRAPDVPPPDLGERSDIGEDYSRPTPELVKSESVTDADSVFSIQYSDSERTSGADAAPVGASPGELPELPQEPPRNGNGLIKPASFQEWHDLIEHPPSGKKRSDVLIAMFETLYPGRDPPKHSYLNKAASDAGGAGRLADLLWQYSTRPPTGDVLAYCLKVAKNAKQDEVSQFKEIDPCR